MNKQEFEANVKNTRDEISELAMIDKTIKNLIQVCKSNNEHLKIKLHGKDDLITKDETRYRPPSVESILHNIGILESEIKYTSDLLDI